eukprot:3438526-Ditylum_brightwellii.AAC.2
MKHNAQLWSHLLWVSGGLLKSEKCSYHLLHWKFEASRRPFLSTSNPDTPLQVCHAKTNQPVDIPYNSMFNPHKTLGHYKALAGLYKEQMEVLKKKADAYALHIMASPLSSTESHIFYCSIFQKALGYVLGQSCIPVNTIERHQTEIPTHVCDKVRICLQHE